MDRLLRIFSEFKEMRGDFSLEHARCFLFVARNEGCSLQDISNELNIPQPSTSRYIKSMLGDEDLRVWEKKLGKADFKLELGSKGMGLISQTINPKESRKKSYFITKKGRELFKNFENKCFSYPNL